MEGSQTKFCRAALAVLALGASGCMGLTPQLHPTDMAELEQLEDRGAREAAYIEHAIVKRGDFRGIRYTKGTRLGDRPRSWQSLDLILRSDRNSAAALPENKIRAARVLTGFLAATSLALVAGFASSAREGLDLSRPTGTSAVLIGAGVSTLAFAIAAGVTWNQTKKGYEAAVDVYNDSLALRLGINDANGEYIPPPGVLIDEEGYIILDQKELLIPGNRPAPSTEAPVMQPPADAEESPREGPEGPASDGGPSLEAAPPPPLTPDAPSLEAAPPAPLEPDADDADNTDEGQDSSGAGPTGGSDGGSEAAPSSLVGPSRAFRLR